MRLNGESKPSLHVCRLLLGLGACLIVCACGLSEEDLSRMRRSGQQAFAAGQYEQALEHWQRLLENSPLDGDAHLKIGRAHLRLGELSRAVEHFTRAVEIRPENGWGWHELARVHLLRGKADLSLEYSAKAGQYLPEEPQVAVLEGQIHFFLQDFAAAEERYREVLDRAPEQAQALVQLALCLAAQDRSAAAAEVFAVLQALEPKDPMVLLAMADYWMLRGRPEQAASVLTRGLEQHPGTLLFAQRLAEWYFDSGQYPAAEQQARRILEHRPDQVYARKLLAETLLAEKAPEQARVQLDRLQAVIPNDTEFVLLKGKHRLLTGCFNQAAACFQTAIDSIPQLPAAHYLKGIALLRQGHVHLARKRFVRALALAPLYTEAELALAGVALYQDELSTALEYTERVLQREPANTRACMIQGIVRLLRADYDGAARAFRQAERLAPNPDAARYFQAETASRNGQADQALQLYRRILKQNPLYADVSRAYTRLLAANDRLGEAEAFFAGLSHMTRHAGYASAFLGTIHTLQGRLDQAEADWLAALESASCPPAVYSALAGLYQATKQPRREQAILERFLAEHPALSTAALQLAAHYYETGEQEQAVGVLEKSLRHNPDDPFLLSNVAWLLLQKDSDLLRALSLAQEAYRRAPEEPAVVDTLGWAYYKKKLYTRAIWHLQEARDLDPDNALIREHLRTAMQEGRG